MFRSRSIQRFFGIFRYSTLLFSVVLIGLSPESRATEFEYRYLDRSHSKTETLGHFFTTPYIVETNF